LGRSSDESSLVNYGRFSLDFLVLLKSRGFVAIIEKRVVDSVDCRKTPMRPLSHNRLIRRQLMKDESISHLASPSASEAYLCDTAMEILAGLGSCE
jgi:hypothetical protein